MIKNTLLTLSLFSCSINSDVFFAWLTQDLLPKTPKESVIVMDKATFHKRNHMLDALKQHECMVEFLPPYSPDLNPIENKWAHAKSVRRKNRMTTDELLTQHVPYAKLS